LAISKPVTEETNGGNSIPSRRFTTDHDLSDEKAYGSLHLLPFYRLLENILRSLLWQVHAPQLLNIRYQCVSTFVSPYVLCSLPSGPGHSRSHRELDRSRSCRFTMDSSLTCCPFGILDRVLSANCCGTSHVAFSTDTQH
jgi:hypothetical protein